MTALTKDRATPERDGQRVSDPLAASTTIYAGAMYTLNATGAAEPASASSAGPVRAVAVKRAATSAGDAAVEGAVGVFQFGNSAGAGEVKRADIGATCYAADDQTVTKTAGSLKAAGTVFDVDDAGVWVRIGA